jgi:hypothetical protein
VGRGHGDKFTVRIGIKMHIIPFEKANKANFLLFQHIPKTGGTALSSRLHEYYGDPNYRWYHGPDGALQTLTEPDLSYKAIGGHFNMFLSKGLNIERELVLITLLREPVDRVLSQYYYLKVASEHPLCSIVNKYTIEEILTNNIEECRPHFVNLLTYKLTMEPETINGLNSAKENLSSYTFFGFQNDIMGVEKFLGNLFGLSWFTIPLLNPNKGRVQLPDVSKKTIELIREYNQDDVELYNYAKILSKERGW